MRKIHLVAVVAGLGAIAALVYAPPALQRRREAVRAQKERAWTQEAVHQLEQTPPPAANLKGGISGLPWVSVGYLVFSNGWAAYQMHSLHAEDGLGDIALLLGSDGTLYSSCFHFCRGPTDDFRASMQSAGAPQPKNLKEFLEKYATSWKPFSGS